MERMNSINDSLDNKMYVIFLDAIYSANAGSSSSF